MSRKPSVKLNFIYNMGYQIFTMLIPLITTPYISKVLLTDGVGKYSYTYSIVNYFVIFAQLGFDYYAQREIAKVQDRKYEQSIVFFEIMIVKFATVSISCIAYISLCSIGVFKEYTPLMWCWLVLILAQLFDVAFIFKGNEEFSKIVFRNMFVKIMGIAATFLFVKTKDDTWIYILSISISSFLGVFTTWVYLPRYICKINKKDLKPMKHILPAVRLFIPTVASILYTYLDKTLIGTMIKDTYVETKTVVQDGMVQTVEVVKKYADYENGLYEQAEKIVKIGMSVITALGAVMLPRNAKEKSIGNENGLRENIYTASRFIMLIGIPIMLGLVGLSDILVPWFLGNDFFKSIIYIKLFCPLVILIGLDNVFGMQYLMATNRDKQYTYAILSGALVNVGLNCVLIPKLWGYGAILASVVAELVIVIIMYCFIRKEISIYRIFKDSIKYILASIVMLLLMLVTREYLEATPVGTIVLLTEAMFSYGIMLILMKDKLVIDNITKVIYKFKKRK